MENTTCACEALELKLSRAEKIIENLLIEFRDMAKRVIDIERTVIESEMKLQGVEVKLQAVEDKLKVTELTGKGDRYETKLLAPKNVAEDLGGGAEVDKIKPEHCTVDELFAEIQEAGSALQKLQDKISGTKS